MNLEILARLTAFAKPAREKLDRSVSRLPPEVIAGALPSDRFRRDLIMAAYMLDAAALKEAYELLHVRLADFIKVKPPCGIHLYRALSKQAVMEVVKDSWLTCPTCLGTLLVIDRAKQTIASCTTCRNGVIRKKLTVGERYREIQGHGYLGVDKISLSAFKGRWRSVYDIIYRYTLNQHHLGENEVMDNL